MYAYFHHKLTHIFSYIIIMNLIQKHSEPEDDVCLVRNDYNIAFAWNDNSFKPMIHLIVVYEYHFSLPNS